MDKSLSSSYSSSLEGSSLDGEILIFSCSHLLFSYYESSFFFFFPKFVESNHFLLAHVLQMNESHDPGRPFKVVIKTSTFCTSSSIASGCSLIWDTLVKYDCMVSALWIFTFFNWFLKVIFWFIFFPSNSLVKESNIFGVFRRETWGTSWSVTESTMILLALTKFF